MSWAVKVAITLVVLALILPFVLLGYLACLIMTGLLTGWEGASQAIDYVVREP